MTELRFRVIAPVLATYGPNGRAHWRKIDLYKREVKEQAQWLARASNAEITGDVTYRVIVGLTKRQLGKHTPDDDNIQGHTGLKAMRDGLAAELTGGDDAQWKCAGIELVPDERNLGFIEFVIEQAA